MTETAILYIRTADTPRDATTYESLLDELKSAYIPDANKIIFETRIRQFEGFEKRYKNKIRPYSHINTDTQLSQKNTHYGLEAYDVDIFGNFKDKSHITKLDSFAEQDQTPTAYPDGIVGLYVIKSDFLNKDPSENEGYSIVDMTQGRIARLKEIWDFKITLRFGGIL